MCILVVIVGHCGFNIQHSNSNTSFFAIIMSFMSSKGTNHLKTCFVQQVDDKQRKEIEINYTDTQDFFISLI